MKQALELCSLAVNSSAPSPTAGFVKVEDGFMVAYGGLMCIRVPVSFAFGCAFNPVALKVFYRKERKKLSYSVKKNKLLIQEGSERVTVPCLPPSEMVTLDAIAPITHTEFPVKLLKYVSNVVDPSYQTIAAQGVTLRNGSLIGTNNRVFIMAPVKLPKDLRFNIHRDACTALAKFKSKVTGIATDGRVIKFIFADDSSLTTHNIVDELPALSHLVDLPVAEPVKLSEELIEDLLKIDCHRFILTEGAIAYQNEDESMTGRIEVPGLKGEPIAIRKENFAYVLRNGGEIYRNEENRFLRSINNGVVAVAMTTRL